MKCRNFIKELHELGWTYKRIAAETGYSKDSCQSIAIGRRPTPKSNSAKYKVLRDVSRRASYAAAKKEGLPSKIARLYRRVEPQGIGKVIEREKQWIVKTETDGYQLAIIGDFYNSKLGKLARGIECYSYIWPAVVINQMTDECEKQGQAQLGGSNWYLVMISSQIITRVKSK